MKKITKFLLFIFHMNSYNEILSENSIEKMRKKMIFIYKITQTLNK